MPRMKPTRRTQPLRKKLRAPSAAVSNATRGRTVGDYNPQDAGRAAAKSTVAPAKKSGLGGKLRAGAVIGAQPRTHQTTRGKRRLSAEEAYSRRTTDSSRARALKLYGLKEAPASWNRSLAPGEATLPRGNGPQNLGRGNLAQNIAPPVKRRRRRGLGSKLRSV